MAKTLPLIIPDWSLAEAHLSKADHRFRKVIERVGPCTLAPRGDPFTMLCKSIFSQQISTAIAAILFERFRKLFPRGKITPAAVLRAFDADPEGSMKKAGLSRQKHAYIRDLADHFATKRIPVRQLPNMTDEEVIQSLIAVKGVGRWTAEMFLMFTLNRPDVLPVDDLGLREGVKDVFGLAERPKPKEVIVMAELWRPWRTIATWYLWRRNDVPTVKA